jgi:hypothetical protein
MLGYTKTYYLLEVRAMWWLRVPVRSPSEVLIDNLGFPLGPGKRPQGKMSFDWLTPLF